MRCLSFLLALLLPTFALAQPKDASKELPKVLLLGDSIRLGYAPLVAKKLDGVAEVVSPKENGGDSANTLKLLDGWLAAGKPVVVHVNCGLHDLKFGKKTNAFQVPPDDYEKNLKAIVGKLAGAAGGVRDHDADHRRAARRAESRLRSLRPRRENLQRRAR